MVSHANKKCISNREQITMHNTQMISPGHSRCHGPERRSVSGVVVKSSIIIMIEVDQALGLEAM